MSEHTPEPFITAEPTSTNTTHAPSLGETLGALPSDAHRPEQTRFTRARQAAVLKRLADTGEVRVAARAFQHLASDRLPDAARLS